MTAAPPEVEVVLLDLGAFGHEHDALEATLAPDEREAAVGFGDPAARARFVLRRGALRRLLAARVGVAPAALAWRVAPGGKPALEGSDLRFSASSSGDLFAVAIARALEVGLDVERLRAVPGADIVAEPILSPRDGARLRALPSAARAEAFLRVFTLREAAAKQTGLGIGGGRGGLELPLEALTGDGAWGVSTDGGRPLHLCSRRIGDVALLALAAAVPAHVRWPVGHEVPDRRGGAVVGTRRPG